MKLRPFSSFLNTNKTNSISTPYIIINQDIKFMHCPLKNKTDLTVLSLNKSSNQEDKKESHIPPIEINNKQNSIKFELSPLTQSLHQIQRPKTGNDILKIIKSNKDEILSKYDLIFSKDKLVKKSLKGKLMSLKKKTALVNIKELNRKLFSQNNKEIEYKNFVSKFKPQDDRIKIGIYTNKYNSLLEDKNLLHSRLQDYAITADELIYKNFSEEEIKLINSDPKFFKMDQKEFTNVEFFKKKNFIDILKDEEKTKSFSNNISRNLKRSIRVSTGKLDQIFKSPVKNLKIKKIDSSYKPILYRRHSSQNFNIENINKEDETIKSQFSEGFNKNNNFKDFRKLNQDPKNEIFENRKRLLHLAFKK